MRRSLKLFGIFGVVLCTACGSNSDPASNSPHSGGTSSAGTGGKSVNPSGGMPSGGGSSGGSSNGGSSNGGSSSGGSSSGGTGGTSSTPGLASKYPGDVGIENDPDVVWAESFEEGSVAAVVARYDDSKSGGLSLDSDIPSPSQGQASMKMTAGTNSNAATDFYKNLGTGYDEIFIRYYAKYQGSVLWHHTSAWIGGYNPPSNWPNPGAGTKPDGSDRLSVSFEPISDGSSAPNPRMDFYDYWMKMHSWMDNPSGDGAYWGNVLINKDSVRVSDDQWMCIEIHVKLNSDPGSTAGAQLEVWRDDVSIMVFGEQTPVGYWVKDKFCPDGADTNSCVTYKPANPSLAPLDLQFRTTTDLKLNAFWPQNYITDDGEGVVWYDDMVLAKTRIGCIH